MAKKKKAEVIPISPLPTDEDIDEEWLIPSSDENGHNVRIQTRVPPGYVAAIQKIIQSGDFPYRTDSDLFRHAVHRLMRELHGMPRNRKVRGYISKLELANSIVQDSERDAATQAFFDVTIQKMQKLQAAGHMQQVIRLDRKLRAVLFEESRGYWFDVLKKMYDERVTPLIPKSQRKPISRQPKAKAAKRGRPSAGRKKVIDFGEP